MVKFAVTVLYVYYNVLLPFLFSVTAYYFIVVIFFIITNYTPESRSDEAPLVPQLQQSADEEVDVVRTRVQLPQIRPQLAQHGALEHERRDDCGCVYVPILRKPNKTLGVSVCSLLYVRTPPLGQ